MPFGSVVMANILSRLRSRIIEGNIRSGQGLHSKQPFHHHVAEVFLRCVQSQFYPTPPRTQFPHLQFWVDQERFHQQKISIISHGIVVACLYVKFPFRGRHIITCMRHPACSLILCYHVRLSYVIGHRFPLLLLAL